ncbi:MAG: hypothetical protein LBT46_04005 [Planctomycetaceae bacterium]|jgi:hypothetical protein|nr:hypothetical protein [Planctomycetaceae bacterium]
MNNPYIRYFAAAVILLLVAVYYVVSTQHRNKTLYSSGEKRTILFGGEQVLFSRFSGAETLRHEKSPKLVKEISSVLKQKGMPADVFMDDVPDSINIAVTLNKAFQTDSGNEDSGNTDSPDKGAENADNKNKDDSAEDLKKLWGSSPMTGWDVDKSKIDSLTDILKKFEHKRLTVRGMLEQPKTVFYYLYYRDQKWQMRLDTDASQYIADYALLEEYALARALLRGDIPAATEAAAYVFRLAQLADGIGVIGVRCDAALTRLRFMEVLQRIVLDPKTEKEHLVFLRDMLSEQLEHWSPEHLTWFGDRASGISLYQRVMLSGPDGALEPFEVDKLQSRNVYLTFVKGFLKNHAADEAFYLWSMQQIIDSSKERFFKRIDTINTIQNTLLKLQDTKNEPFVAGLVLDNVDKFMRLFAQDLSRIETAVLALRLALEGSKESANRIASSPLDPFTGKAYQVKNQDGYVEVSAQNRLQPFRVKIISGSGVREQQ